jgi:hypothetical protein
LQERRIKDFTELGRNIEERRQREPAILELWMRHAKRGRVVRAALIPKQVEINASGPPPLAGSPTAAQAPFGA